MIDSFLSIIKKLETMLHKVALLKLVLFVIPISMIVTLVYAFSSDVFNTIGSSFFR